MKMVTIDRKAMTGSTKQEKPQQDQQQNHQFDIASFLTALQSNQADFNIDSLTDMQLEQFKQVANFQSLSNEEFKRFLLMKQEAL